MGADGSKEEAKADEAAPAGAAAKAAPAAAAAGKGPHVPTVAELEGVMKTLDTNNDGKLDMAELKSGMKHLGSPMTEQEIETLFKKADHNGDGSIDAAEFVHAAQGKTADPKAQAAAQAAIVAKAEQKMKENAAKHEAKPAAKAAAAATAAASIASPAAAPKAAASADAAKDKGKNKPNAKAKDKGTRLCVKNLAEDMTQEQLKTLFEPFGAILHVNLKTKEDGKCRGFAFVTFGSIEEANKAIAGLDTKDISGKQLSVALAEAKPAQEGEKGEKGKGKGKGKEKGADATKGKGKGKKGAAASPVVAQAAAYQNPYLAMQQQAYGMQQQQAYGGYPYGYPQQGYGQQQQMHPAMAQQMQAAQIAQMQQMVQGMYLQAVAHQTAGGGGASPKAAMTPGLLPKASAMPPPTGQDFVGKVKSLSSRHGYGFIECQESKTLYDRDVYVADALLPEGCKDVGSMLKFTVGLNSKGHPQALTCSKA